MSSDPRQHRLPRFGRLVDHVPGPCATAKIRAAKRGEVPGAFQLAPGRTWWIDLDQWEQHLRDLKARYVLRRINP